MSGPFAKLIPVEKPIWPPMWNPFQVFILGVALIQTPAFLLGHSGSKVLDDRLADGTVVLWGICVCLGSAMGLVGLWLYRRFDSLMPGLYLERGGTVLFGTACFVYSFVVLKSAADLNDARWAAFAQSAFGLACFMRAWQDHRAIRRALAMTGRQPWRELWNATRSSFGPGGGSG